MAPSRTRSGPTPSTLDPKAQRGERSTSPREPKKGRMTPYAEELWSTKPSSEVDIKPELSIAFRPDGKKRNVYVRGTGTIVKVKIGCIELHSDDAQMTEELEDEISSSLNVRPSASVAGPELTPELTDWYQRFLEAYLHHPTSTSDHSSSGGMALPEEFYLDKSPTLRFHFEQKPHRCGKTFRRTGRNRQECAMYPDLVVVTPIIL